MILHLEKSTEKGKFGHRNDISSSERQHPDNDSILLFNCNKMIRQKENYIKDNVFEKYLNSVLIISLVITS